MRQEQDIFEEKNRNSKECQLDVVDKIEISKTQKSHKKMKNKSMTNVVQNTIFSIPVHMRVQKIIERNNNIQQIIQSDGSNLKGIENQISTSMKHINNQNIELQKSISEQNQVQSVQSKIDEVISQQNDIGDLDNLELVSQTTSRINNNQITPFDNNTKDIQNKFNSNYQTTFSFFNRSPNNPNALKDQKQRRERIMVQEKYPLNSNEQVEIVCPVIKQKQFTPLKLNAPFVKKQYMEASLTYTMGFLRKKVVDADQQKSPFVIHSNDKLRLQWQNRVGNSQSKSSLLNQDTNNYDNNFFKSKYNNTQSRFFSQTQRHHLHSPYSDPVEPICEKSSNKDDNEDFQNHNNNQNSPNNTNNFQKLLQYSYQNQDLSPTDNLKKQQQLQGFDIGSLKINNCGEFYNVSENEKNKKIERSKQSQGSYSQEPSPIYPKSQKNQGFNEYYKCSEPKNEEINYKNNLRYKIQQNHIIKQKQKSMNGLLSQSQDNKDGSDLKQQNMYNLNDIEQSNQYGVKKFNNNYNMNRQIIIQNQMPGSKIIAKQIHSRNQSYNNQFRDIEQQQQQLTHKVYCTQPDRNNFFKKPILLSHQQLKQS